MKTTRICALLLAFCMLMCACSQQISPSQNDPSVSDGQQNTPSNNDAEGNQTQDAPSTSDNQHTDPPNTNTDPTPDIDNNTDTPQPPLFPDELTVEVVVDWEHSDSVLSQLNNLADLLHTAIKNAGYHLDDVIVTISTAGGVTADTLVRGGIDAAILPSLDVISFEKNVSILALSNEEIPEIAIAASQADNKNLSEEFNRLLFTALTETEEGQFFLFACCGTNTFSLPTEDNLQSVRDQFKELEKAEGGHA